MNGDIFDYKTKKRRNDKGFTFTLGARQVIQGWDIVSSASGGIYGPKLRACLAVKTLRVYNYACRIKCKNVTSG
jgi:hypothetical protein